MPGSSPGKTNERLRSYGPLLSSKSVGHALAASARAERQRHIGGCGLPRTGFDLPHDLDHARIGRRRIAAPLALLDDPAVDHVDFAGASLQQVLQHGVSAAARPDM